MGVDVIKAVFEGDLKFKELVFGVMWVQKIILIIEYLTFCRSGNTIPHEFCIIFDDLVI